MGTFVGRVVGDGASTAHALDGEEARRALAVLTAGWPGPVGTRGIRRGTVTGEALFPPGDPAAAAAHAAAVSRSGYTPYVVINPFLPGHAGALKDAFVGRRRWLLIDVDPCKPADHKDDPATDAEKDAATQLAHDALAWLTAAGWPEPVQIDSGNGYYLLYRIDLANDGPARELVSQVLHAVKQRFLHDPRGKIDTTVCNAARLAKLPGGLAVKGAQSAERPYRRCRLVHAPEAAGVVTAEQLADLAGAVEMTKAQRQAFDKAESAMRGRVTGGQTAESRAAAYLAAVPGAVSGQRGHAATLWAARVLVKGFLLSQAQALGLMRDCYNPRCSPPWSERELEHKVEQAAAVPFGKPDGWMLTDDAPARHAGNGRAGKAPAGQPPEAGAADAPPTWSIRQDGEEVAAGAPVDILPDLSAALGDDGARHARVLDLFTLGAILSTDYPEPNWVVPGVMSEGLNILAGAPKQGKSVLALNLALTVAGGGKALGDVRVEPADVLYLALEDKPRRIKSRAVKMLRQIQPDLAGNVAARLTVATDWPRQHEQGLAAVAWWLKRAERPRLVIIDVWYRFGPPQNDRGNAYAQDAEHLGQLKRFADAHGVSVLLVHHTRKASHIKEPDDYLQEVSGTMGVTGAADGILVLLRNRNEGRAVLNVTGRDVGDTQLVLEFDPASLTWKSLGTKDEHTHGTVKAKVIAHLKACGPRGNNCPAIALAIDESQDSVRKALARMVADRWVNKAGHTYTWPGDGDRECFD